MVDHPEALFESADAVLLVTDWHAYSELSWPALKLVMRTPLVVDGRCFLDRQMLASAGYRILAIP